MKKIFHNVHNGIIYNFNHVRDSDFLFEFNFCENILQKRWSSSVSKYVLKK